MEHIFNFVPFLFNFYKLDVKQKESVNANKKIQYSIRMFHIFNLTLFIILSFFDVFLSNLDIKRFSTSIASLSSNIRILSNYIIILINIKKIRKVMQKLPQVISHEECRKFKLREKFRACLIPSIFALLSANIVAAKSLFTIGLTQVRKDFLTIDFEFVKRNKMLEVLYNLWPIYTTSSSVSLGLMFESLIYGIIIMLTYEVEKLNERIHEINKELDESKGISRMFKVQCLLRNPQIFNSFPKPDKFKIRNSRISKILSSIITKHVQLISIRNDLEEILSLIFLINIMCNTVTLCFVEFTALTYDDTTIKVMATVIAVIQFGKTFMQCFYCQQLKDASLNISNAIYALKWENIEDVKIKRHMMMIMLTSQKYKSLTCGKFYENSYELYGTVSCALKKCFGI